MKSSLSCIFWLHLEKISYLLWHKHTFFLMIFFCIFLKLNSKFQALDFFRSSWTWFSNQIHKNQSIYSAHVFAMTKLKFTFYSESMHFFKTSFIFSPKLRLQTLVFYFFQTSLTCFSNLTVKNLKNPPSRIFWLHQEKNLPSLVQALF